MNTKSETKPKEKKKGFWTKIWENLDKKMEEKAKNAPCCGSIDKSKGKPCC